MKNLYENIQPFKFRLTIFVLLCGATILSLILFRVRTVLSDKLDCISDLEHLPGVDSTWVGDHRHNFRVETKTACFRSPHRRSSLAALFSKCAVYPDRPPAPWKPQT